MDSLVKNLKERLKMIQGKTESEENLKIHVTTWLLGELGYDTNDFDYEYRLCRRGKDRHADIYVPVNSSTLFVETKKYSNGKSPYYGRLELRSKRIGDSIEYEFLELWFDRLDKAALHFEEVQHRFNRSMAQLYLEDLAKKKKDREFLSVNSFLMTRKDYIFTSSQMKELLMMIGFTEDKATNKAYNFKKLHTIEYYKKEDLDFIITDIKAKITDYFSK